MRLRGSSNPSAPAPFAGMPGEGKAFARPPRKRSLPAERVAKPWISQARRGYHEARTVTATAGRRASRPLQNTAGLLHNATPAPEADLRTQAWGQAME